MIYKITKIILLFLITLFIGISLGYQYPKIFDVPKSYIAGIKHAIFPIKIVDNIEIKTVKYNEEIEANAFRLSLNNVAYVSLKDLIDQNQDIPRDQLLSAGLFGELLDNKPHLTYFNRSGFKIGKNKVEKFILPKTYDPHNNSGGIRGIFFFNSKPYAWMVAKKIGCQYVAIVSLSQEKEIFKTDCLPDYKRIHFSAVGGASIHFNDQIYLTVGSPSNSSEEIRMMAQNKNSFFGKIIAIDKQELLETQIDTREFIEPKIVSMGHRNPQGIAIINDQIFSSEHGPKGGDEINLIVKGNNYGWPISSYGTKYILEPGAEFNQGKKLKKFYKNSHLKYDFSEPFFQFTPSIAISDLSKCPLFLLDYYEDKNCLIATSLKNKSIYIFIISENNDRIIGFERINFKKRLRHFALKKDGNIFEYDNSIYISTDDGYVLDVKFTFNK